MADPEAPTADGLGYADAVTELEAILARLEDDRLDIDVLAKEVRRAAELIGWCRRRIEAARVEVDQIVVELSPDPTGTLADVDDP